MKNKMSSLMKQLICC